MAERRPSTGSRENRVFRGDSHHQLASATCAMARAAGSHPESSARCHEDLGVSKLIKSSAEVYAEGSSSHCP